MKEQLNKLRTLLFQPVDASALGTFRIFFGLMMVMYIFGYHPPDVLEYRYIRPDFYFSFPLFKILHLPVWPPKGMIVHFMVMGLAACALTLGLFFRFSAIIYFLTLSYIFLLEKTYSPNPIYFYMLLTLLLSLSHANRFASLDAIIHRNNMPHTVPFWQMFILRAQVCIAYFYSGMAKLTHGDWLNGSQLRIWLGHYKDSPLVGSLVTQDWLVYLYSYGGVMFDLSVGFLLCIRRTRILGIALALFFHLNNKLILGLENFPYVMMTTLFLFLDPKQPREWMAKIADSLKLPVSIIGNTASPAAAPYLKRTNTVIYFLSVYLIIQLLVPLRHWFYSGDVNWTQRGQHFSWHFMNNNMYGETKFNYPKPKDLKKFEFPLITPQQRFFMSVHPDCILQYAHKIRDNLKKAGIQNPTITVDAKKSLNGRPLTPLIDPKANLAEIEDTPAYHAHWILPHPDSR